MQKVVVASWAVEMDRLEELREIGVEAACLAHQLFDVRWQQDKKVIVKM